MKIIVGLGNPGKKYEYTRHNAGFLAVDFVLQGDEFITAKPSREFKSEMFTLLGKNPGGEKVIFLKPQTFMNDTGQVINLIANFYKFTPQSDLLIIHDEVDLPFGQFKLAKNSSSAGHKGVQDIIEKLGTQDFSRIRIGVETRVPESELPTDAFVLQNFTGQELEKLLSEILPEAKKEILKFISL